jgi:acetyltransferase-like isoleucine patch superfamily enzyme
MLRSDIESSYLGDAVLLNLIKRRLCVGRNVIVGDNFHVGFGSSISATNRLRVGSDVSVGRYCLISGNGQIGNRVKISDHVAILEPINFFQTLDGRISEVENATNPNLKHFICAGHIIVENDVRIGFGALVMGGAIIGRGAIVEPGAVVNSYVRSYSVVGGNPAKFIRQIEGTDTSKPQREVDSSAPDQSISEAAE